MLLAERFQLGITVLEVCLCFGPDQNGLVHCNRSQFVTQPGSPD